MNKKFSVFQNCLRMQIIPDEYQDERIERLVLHCNKYKINNVILNVNAEDLFAGHLTPKEISPWVRTAKKAAEKLRKENISIGLHHWITIGHLDRGIPLSEGQNFTTMVDFNGKRSQSVACPLCENWRAHFTEFLGYLIREIKPDFYWLEDDFRLHNHSPLEWGGCFCEKHIAEFNRALGTAYTREEFCEKAFSKGIATPERKAWLDVSRKTILDLASFVSQIIKTANPETSIALMSSFPQEHCLEARDWHGLFDIIGKDSGKYNRIHLPGYTERPGKEYMFDFNSISMAIREFSPKETEILPELENGPISDMRKTPSFLRFQLEAAMPLCLSGMTYNIFDNVGNGSIEEHNTLQQIEKTTPYLQAVMDLGVEYSDLKGIIVPIDEEIAYKIKIKNSFYDMRTNLFIPAGFLSGLGLGFKFSKKTDFENETVALFGDSVYIFSDDELKSLFAKNKVMIDGGAALLLFERGLLSLIGAESLSLSKAETGYQIYEQAEGKIKIQGVEGMRASMRAAAGDFVKIEYSADVDILTRAYSSKGELAWPALVKHGNTLVIPYIVNGLYYSQYSELRRHIISEFARENSKCIVDSGIEGINPYLYIGKSDATLMLVNASLENYDSIKLFVKGVEFSKVISVDRDGKERNADFSYENGVLSVNRPLLYMSSATLKLLK